MSFGAKLVSLPVMFLINIYEDNYKYIIMNGNLQSTLKYYTLLLFAWICLDGTKRKMKNAL